MIPIGDGELVAIGLASLRLLGLFAVAPFFGHASVPVRIRGALSLLMGVALAPYIGAPAATLPDHPLAVAGTVVGEFLAGAALGFAARLVFAALDVLGEIASIQGGLGAAQVLDPAGGISSASLGRVLGILGLGTWLAIGGHHDLVRALVASYEVLPAGGGGPSPDSFLAIAGLAAPIFSLGVQLAAPVTVAMLVSNAAVGMLGRLIPQLNLIVLQLPVHVAMTLLLLAFGAHGISGVIETEMSQWTGRALGALAGEG